MAAQNGLPQAGVGIDDAGQGDHARGIDHLGACRVERRSDGGDCAIVADQDVAVRQIAQRLVHGDDIGAADQLLAPRHG